MAMVMVSISLQKMIVMAALGVELGTKLFFFFNIFVKPVYECVGGICVSQCVIETHKSYSA